MLTFREPSFQALVRIAYWQANADGWTEFESVSGGCGWLGWVVSARGTAASSPPPPRPVKRYQKSADGARAVCGRWCRPPAEFQTTGNIWTHSWCAPSPGPHLTRPVNQYIANLNRFLLKSHFTNLAQPAADEAISKQ